MEQSDRVRFAVWDNADEYSFVEAEGIVVGETAVWKGIVDETGFLWIYKNKELLNSVQGSAIPGDVVRSHALVLTFVSRKHFIISVIRTSY